MIVTTSELFKHAYGKYAIGAYNINNLEQTMGLFKGNVESKAPFIVQLSKGARSYTHKLMLETMMTTADKIFPEAVFAVHLDHGDEETCMDCIASGVYSSVMIDASHYPLEKNIEITKRVVDAAHAKGIVVEAELGQLKGVEEDVSSAEHVYTKPEEAEYFVKQTGCDSLAAAIGTSHGAFKFKGEPKLRFDILEEVGRRLPNFPIVLHGASSVIPEYVEMINKYGGKLAGAQGVPEHMLRKAASMAVCKINIDSDLRLAFTAMIRKHLAEHPEHFDPRQYLTDARAALKGMVKHKIVNVLGCNGKN